MDLAFRGDELFVGCQGDGTAHAIEVPSRTLEEQLQGRNGLRIARIFLNLGAMATKPVPLSKAKARRIWLRAQRLDEKAPFGAGAQATRGRGRASRRRADRHHQRGRALPSPDSLHAHSGLPARASASGAVGRQERVRILDLRALLHSDCRHPLLHARDEARGGASGMVHSGDGRRPPESACPRRSATERSRSATSTTTSCARRITMASRKPSRRALQLAFFRAAHGEPARGHAEDLRADNAAFRLGSFAEAGAGASAWPISSTAHLRAQGVVSLDSICHLDAPRKAAIRKLIGQRVRRGELVPVALDGAEDEHWVTPEMLEAPLEPAAASCTSSTRSIRSSIQRKRLAADLRLRTPFRGLRAEAAAVFGYFAQPVLVGDEIVAAPRPEDRSRARQAPHAEVDLVAKRARGAAAEDRRRAGPVRAVSARAITISSTPASSCRCRCSPCCAT